MPDYLFQLPEAASGTLQARIHEMMVNAILNHHIAPGSPMPSGRKLAEQLKVARNTVVLAYQSLIDEGFIEARERSGFYVREDVLDGYVDKGRRGFSEPTSSIDWDNAISFKPSDLPYNQKPKDWQSYPYPFLYGQFDKTLFPVADWRECCREAASISAIHNWAGDRIDQDNAQLVKQIHAKMLPRRGIWSNPDEILITLGAQHAIHIASQLLLNQDRTIGMENPGYVDARNTFLTQTNNIELLSVDDRGLIIDEEKLAECDLVYTTPSHHFPTTVTMPARRRRRLLEAADKHNFFIIEDDYESEFNYLGKPTPALKSLDTQDRVIYVGSLSKTLAPGIRLGYMVAPKPFIDQARALRRLMLRHPPSNNQYIISHFLKRGYHDSLVRRITSTLHHRSKLVQSMLNELLPGSIASPTFGGSSYWVKGPENIDANELAQKAKEKGILIEPGDIFFHGENRPKNYFRLGFSSISEEKIDAGLPILAELIGS
ncbi:MAG: GntR family transcriptional regulator/MocR family aminotransferase [Parvicella sp.]|jgi:GntR family transcriptional regulator/MocR family aminotransferase